MRPFVDREQLGRLVYRTMVELAGDRTGDDPTLLGVPWEDLPEEVREADRRIGEAVADAVLEAAMGVRVGEDTEHRIEVQSGFGANTREPFVTLTLPDGRDRIQMRAHEARDLAVNILQGAEAALTDGLVVEFFRGKVGLGMPEVAGILSQLRAYRVRKSKEGA